MRRVNRIYPNFVWAKEDRYYRQYIEDRDDFIYSYEDKPEKCLDLAKEETNPLFKLKGVNVIVMLEIADNSITDILIMDENDTLDIYETDPFVWFEFTKEGQREAIFYGTNSGWVNTFDNEVELIRKEECGLETDQEVEDLFKLIEIKIQAKLDNIHFKLNKENCYMYREL